MIYLIIYIVGAILTYVLIAYGNDNNKITQTYLTKALITMLFSWLSVLILTQIILSDSKLINYKPKIIK